MERSQQKLSYSGVKSAGSQADNVAQGDQSITDDSHSSLRIDSCSPRWWEELGAPEMRPQFPKPRPQAIISSAKHIPGFREEAVVPYIRGPIYHSLREASDQPGLQQQKCH